VGKYALGKRIGEGSFSKVKLATDVTTGDRYAIKIIDWSLLGEGENFDSVEEAAESVAREIRLMKLLTHPNIVRLCDIIDNQDTGRTYLVLEFVNRGELFDYIVANGRLKEPEARKFFRQLLSAIEYTHAHGIVHRDLKPENLLLAEENGVVTVKITDFGLSNTLSVNHLFSTWCGSLYYSAPEIVEERAYQGPGVDVWSMGAILYAMVNGRLPWNGRTDTEKTRQICTGDVASFESSLSPEVVDCVKSMLTVDSVERATIDELRKHPWTTGGIYKGEPPECLCPPTSPVTKVNELTLEQLSVLGLVRDTDAARDAAREDILANRHTAAVFGYHTMLKEGGTTLGVSASFMPKSKSKAMGSSAPVSPMDMVRAEVEVFSKEKEKSERHKGSKKDKGSSKRSSGSRKGSTEEAGSAAAASGRRNRQRSSSVSAATLAAAAASPVAPELVAALREDEGGSPTSSSVPASPVPSHTTGSGSSRSKRLSGMFKRLAGGPDEGGRARSQTMMPVAEGSPVVANGSSPPSAGAMMPGARLSGGRDRSNRLSWAPGALAAATGGGDSKKKVLKELVKSSGGLGKNATPEEYKAYMRAKYEEQMRTEQELREAKEFDLDSFDPETSDEPPPHPGSLRKHMTVESYKLFMKKKYLYEQWESAQLRKGNKERVEQLRAERAAVDESQGQLARTIKGIFTHQTTSVRDPEDVFDSVGQALRQLPELSFKKKSGLVWRCKDKSKGVSFEIEVVRVEHLGVTGIKFARMGGDVWTYKELTQDVLRSVVL